MTTSQKAQKYFDESYFKLRTPKEHLKTFPFTQNLPHDIMHDILEGVIPYENITLILKLFGMIATISQFLNLMSVS